MLALGRGRWLVAIAASALLIACASAHGTASPSGKAEIAPPRSPEGVVLEVSAPMPAPSASSSARGIVVLAEAPPDEAIRDVLFAYFDLLRRNDKDGIASILAEGAVRIDALRGHQGDREAMRTLIAQTMNAKDRSKIVPSEIVVPERIERYSAADLAAANQRRPEDMAPLDVFVRLSIPPPRGAADKLFEESIVFLLRSEGGKLRIVTVNEEAAPPPP